MFGHVDYVIQTAPGTGIVSAAVMQSDDLDEIDWEWLGGDDTQAQSNYFGKGITTTGYNRGAFHSAPNNHDSFHTYSVDWTADQIVWSIDGVTVRAMTQAEAVSGQYPQTPMYIKVGIWAGGDPSNAAGTIEWAGGETDYSAGPFTMYMQSIHVTDYSTGSEYSYSGTSGTWESIVSTGGQINSNGTDDTTETTSTAAAATTSSVSNSAPLAFSNGDTTTTSSHTGWPWSGSATATAVTVVSASTSGRPSECSPCPSSVLVNSTDKFLDLYPFIFLFASLTVGFGVGFFA
jgi:beta-glucanase (GH16 family)